MIQRNQAASTADSPFVKFGLPVLVVVIGVAIFAGLRALKKPPAAADKGTTVPLVSVRSATSYSGNIEIEVSGLATASRELELAAEVEGRVKEKTPACEVGRLVTAGTTLILIDSENLDIEIKQLKAKLQEAVGSLNELDSETNAAKNQIDNLGREVDIRRRELERYLSLDEARKGSVTRNELDSAQLNLVKAENALATLNDEFNLLTARRTRLENSVALAQAQLDRTELDLKRCEIKAPIDGVIIEELIEEERFVSRGTPLVRISDTSKIEVECNLQIDDYQQVLENTQEPLPPYALPGNEVDVIYRANGRRILWDGKLTRTKGLGLDETTRTVPCIVEVSQPINPNTIGINTLVPGMFVKLKIQVPSRTPLIQVPARALQGKNTIWLVQDGVLKKANVEVLAVSDDEDSEEDSEVERLLVVKQVDGLIEAGAQIVTTPVTYQTENQEVNIDTSLNGRSGMNQDSGTSSTTTANSDEQGGANR